MSGDTHADDPDTGEAIQRTLDEFPGADTGSGEVDYRERVERLEQNVDILKDLMGDLTGTLSDVVETVDDTTGTVEQPDEPTSERIRGYE